MTAGRRRQEPELFTPAPGSALEVTNTERALLVMLLVGLDDDLRGELAEALASRECAAALAGQLGTRGLRDLVDRLTLLRLSPFRESVPSK